MHKFFISHYNGDKHVAELFANALRRITLEQISPWFSSDSNQNSGLRPGDMWFQQILSRIAESKAVVSLLTPNSVDRPWVYFESGIGQALDNCEIIPVCIGIQRDSILPPLGLYQCYQLTDYRSIVEFFSKLLALFDIRFDEEMSKVVIEKLVSDISKISFELSPEPDTKSNHDTATALENLRSHIDKRFLELLERPNYGTRGDNLNGKIDQALPGNQSIAPPETSYTVKFSIDFPKLKNDSLFIEIRQHDTFQTITDSLYYMLNDFVAAFKYLEEWIIVEEETDKHVVIREIASRVPARAIFTPDSKWKVISLKKPYVATESRQRILNKRTLSQKRE